MLGRHLITPTSMIHFAPITRDLFVGSYPQSTLDIDQLHRGPRITAVLNLQTDDDIAARSINWPELVNHYLARDMAWHRIPIVDFDDEDLEQHISDAAQFIDQFIAVGHRIYVHCTAGMERSPSVVAAYLHWYTGISLEQATSAITKVRRCKIKKNVIERAVNPNTT